MVLPVSSADLPRAQLAQSQQRSSLTGTTMNRLKGKTRRSFSSSLDIVVICFVVAGTIVAVVSFIGSSFMMQQMDNSGSNPKSPVEESLRKMQQQNRPPRPTVVEVDDLDHEGLFRKLMKSCIPYDSKTGSLIKNTKCGTYQPDTIDRKNNNNNSKEKTTTITTKQVQRIAILAPPGDLSGSLINRVERIVGEYNKLIEQQPSKQQAPKGRGGDTEEVYTPMELIVTSHVPPYGYGKTHGYTKIIRLIPEPLLLEVTDALTAILHPGESHHQVTMIDVQHALRQILRFHCRMNHISAHTAILSIKFMDLFADPISISQQIRNFLIPISLLKSEQQSKQQQLRRSTVKDHPNGGEEQLTTETDDDQSVAAGEGMALEEEEQSTADDDQSSLMDAELAYGSQLLTSIQQQYYTMVAESGIQNDTQRDGRTLLDLLDTVLVNELLITNDMAKWPCLSFWDMSADTDSGNVHDNNSNKNTRSHNNSSTKTGSPLPPMSDIVQRLAKKLSPDCTDDPYNSCFVQRDRCESIGDAECIDVKQRM